MEVRQVIPGATIRCQQLIAYRKSSIGQEVAIRRKLGEVVSMNSLIEGKGVVCTSLPTSNDVRELQVEVTCSKHINRYNALSVAVGGLHPRRNFDSNVRSINRSDSTMKMSVSIQGIIGYFGIWRLPTSGILHPAVINDFRSESIYYIVDTATLHL